MRARRGFTIAEVLVSAAIVGLLTLVGIMIMRLGATSRTRQDRALELQAQGRQAVARLRREMRGARVLLPTLDEPVADQLTYSFPEIKDNLLQVDAGGRAEWAGDARVYQDGDQLKLEKPLGSSPQLLARLDGGGFQARLDPAFLTLTVSVGSPNEPEFRFIRSFRVALGD